MYPPAGEIYYGNHAVTGCSSSPAIIPASNGRDVVLMQSSSSTGIAGVIARAIDNGSSTGGPSLCYKLPAWTERQIDWIDGIVLAGGENVQKETFIGYNSVVPYRRVDWFKDGTAVPGIGDRVPAWEGLEF